MEKKSNGTPPSKVLGEELSINEGRCIRRNIALRVTSMDQTKRSVHCLVQQQYVGVFRRRIPSPELVRIAQQALLPLIRLGLMPMVSVKLRQGNSTITGTAMQRIGWVEARIMALWSWLGFPMAYPGYHAFRLVRDPFGWQRAIALAPAPYMDRYARVSSLIQVPIALRWRL